MFKVGDSVLVRYHSREEKDNYKLKSDGAWWNPYMDTMEGKIYTIYEVLPHVYRVRDENRVRWTFAHDSLVRPYDQF